MRKKYEVTRFKQLKVGDCYFGNFLSRFSVENQNFTFIKLVNNLVRNLAISTNRWMTKIYKSCKNVLLQQFDKEEPLK